MRKTLLTATLFLGLTGSLTLQAQSNAPIDYTPIAPDNIDLQLSTLRADGSLDTETATWYVVYLRDDKLLTPQQDEFGVIIDSEAEISDETMWAIAPTGSKAQTYLLFNKARPDLVLCAPDGGDTPPALTTATGKEAGFQLVHVTYGYGLRIPPELTFDQSENWIVTDLNATDRLGYWNSTAAWRDTGCTLRFEIYDPTDYTFLTGRTYLNAENCIDGFTPEQLQDVRDFVESGDINLESEVEYICENELRYDTRLTYTDGHVYAILSALPQYVPRKNVQMGLYVDNEGTLAWKEFDPKDNRFYFQLHDRQVLQNDEGEDSVVTGLYNLGADAYVANDIKTNEEVTTTEQYSEADNRFHLRLMEETTWPGTSEIIRPYVPAAFYIEHEKEYTWSYGGKELITFCVSLHEGGVDYYTQGTATATSSKFNNNSNIFRFKDLGTPETVGIHSVTAPTSQAGADRIYDLSGRRLQTEPTHGVYLKNGRTVVK